MMVAYSFQKRFVEPVLSGRKTHTLRDPRRRHARVGEPIQLYTGMRTRHCRLLAQATCDRFLGVYLKWSKWQEFFLFNVVEQEPGRFVRHGELRPIAHPDRWAFGDGFDDMEDMGRFWRDVHGVSSWEGFLIGWAPLGSPTAERR